MIGLVGSCTKVELESKGIIVGSLGGMKSRFVLCIHCKSINIWARIYSL